MNKISLLILLVVTVQICYAQTVKTYYYSDRAMVKEVSEEKSKYAEIITTYADGTTLIEKKDTKKNITLAAYKGNEPVGKWTTEIGNGTEIRDYDFTVEYKKEKCPDHAVVKSHFEDDVNAGYKAPIIENNIPFFKHLQKNLRYPARARRLGIQGKVWLTFTVTRENKIENIVVNDGVDIELDKEAVRVIRKIKIISPASRNGEPMDLCVTLPISFKLAN